MVLSLILPCYNPQQGWEHNVVREYNQFCSKINIQAELILVLDGISHAVTEESKKWLQGQVPNLLLISYPDNKGKGYAIRQGVVKATGEFIIYTDVDVPYSIVSMCDIYHALAEHKCDVAVGVKDDNYYNHLPLARKLISRLLRWMISTFLAMPVTDTQCGLKGFSNKVKPLFLSTTINRYLFDLEFIRNCFVSREYKVLPVPVSLNDQVHFRKMNYRILIPEMLNFVRLLFKKPHV